MSPDALATVLLSVLDEISSERRPGEPLGATVSDITVERPRNRDHGDWATNAAMKFAKKLGTSPRELADQIAGQLASVDGVASVEVAGPGFINIRLEAAAAGLLAKTIVEAGEQYGRNDSQAGNSINLEFVSGNPTGPLHIGHTRWAALGDSMGRLLEASGAVVAREYYINDAGAQMDRFGQSVLAAMTGAEAPEDGYKGAYIDELGTKVLAHHPRILDEVDPLAAVRDAAYELQLAEIQESLAKFNVRFDVWFSERELHAGSPSLIDQAVDRLRAEGHVYDADDAVWVRTTDFGDDKDRVIRRGNGIYTYFAADAAYYLNKGDRGYQHKIYLLGADHHGYVHRLKALAGSAGDDPERDIEVLIGQLVSVNGARMSKRAGNIIELDDLREW
ncbi:MAG: arginine--tRNA ligase, partial [Candidatus Microbacterium stercoravium]